MAMTLVRLLFSVLQCLSFLTISLYCILMGMGFVPFVPAVRCQCPRVFLHCYFYLFMLLCMWFGSDNTVGFRLGSYRNGDVSVLQPTACV